jgi:hypothetical protein
VTQHAVIVAQLVLVIAEVILPDVSACSVKKVEQEVAVWVEHSDEELEVLDEEIKDEESSSPPSSVTRGS